MTIYKIVNDKNKTVLAYYLQYGKAMQCLKDIAPWFIESFHIELKIVAETV
jgi:hypothetical protein